MVVSYKASKKSQSLSTFISESDSKKDSDISKAQ